MKAYLTYALNKEGDLVHIDSVPNGNECECFCPHCMSELCAKNEGIYKVHHFAHMNGADCVGAIESALHKMAKDVMKEALCIQLPDRLDGSRGELLKLDRIEVEFYDKETNLRPDCVGYYGDKVIWIEFKRTHAVDTKKKGKIISAKIDCIELDINECELNPDSVRKFIIEETRNRIWIRDTSTKSTRANSFNNNDSYYNYLYHSRVPRLYAKDENGTLVHLNKDEVNMNEHSYYCLACGRELTIDVDQYGAYHFVHIEENVLCVDDLYLREAAKEIIWNKFMTSAKFEISIRQGHNCEKKDTCNLYNPERCQECKKTTYDLKEKKYYDCLKNVKLQDTKYKCDLIIKHAEKEKDDIIINIKTDDCYIDVYRDDYRIINIYVGENILEDLERYPIGTKQTEFLNFTREIKSATPMNSQITRFQLFSSGKFHVDEISCSNIEERRNSTVLEYLFAQDIDLLGAKLYSLLKCYEQGRKACLCAICYFLSSDYICRRYKTKGTPRFPLKELPVGCPHFSLDLHIKNMIKNSCADIQVIENIIK